MTRDELLDDLREAIKSRIDHMFQNLADAYAGSPNAKAATQKHFSDGLRFTKEAAAWTVEQINAQFKE